MNLDYERLRIPINWLAARGMTSRSFEEQFPEPEQKREFTLDNIPMEKIRRIAKVYRKEKEIPLYQAYQEIVTALGFKDFRHYQKFMSDRGEYETSYQVKQKKRMKDFIKRKYGDETPC